MGDAVVLDDIETVKRLLKEGADVNASYGSVGETALLDAAQRGRLRIVRLLLENGADVNAESGLPGRTALMVAAKRGYLNVAKLLLEMGADANISEGKQGSAIQLSCSLPLRAIYQLSNYSSKTGPT